MHTHKGVVWTGVATALDGLFFPGISFGEGGAEGRLVLIVGGRLNGGPDAASFLIQFDDVQWVGGYSETVYWTLAEANHRPVHALNIIADSSWPKRLEAIGRGDHYAHFLLCGGDMCCEVVAASEYSINAFDSEDGAEEELERWRQHNLVLDEEDAKSVATKPSNGWEAVAKTFMTVRSEVGADVVRRWATQLPPGGTVVDLGCGFGEPVTRTLIEAGLAVSGVDASPTLVAEYRRRFPDCPVVCEAAETSDLFGQQFDGALAVGLLFLLPEEDQYRLIQRVARALRSGGRFLFSAPRQVCEWDDRLTRRASRSLGEEAYREALEAVGLGVADQRTDAGGNHYFDAVKA